MHRVLDAAERSFVPLTGYAGFDRDLSQEILAVVLKSVSAEDQDGYARHWRPSPKPTVNALVSCTGSTGRAGSSRTKAAAT